MAAEFAHAQNGSYWTQPTQPSLGLSGDSYASASGLYTESAWREPHRVARSGATDGVVVATRWRDDGNFGRADSALAAPGRHEIAIAMKTTRLRLFRGSQTLFEGLMPVGTLHVADAALPLKIDFQAPCDFIHLSAPSEWLWSDEAAPDGADRPELDGFTMRDALAEGLARSLTDVEAGCSYRYAESVGQTIVMRLLGALRERSKNAGSKVSPLPRWRLKRVQEYVAANISEPVSLPELANVSGLSRMHFAAQFRAATGFRPHEYLLSCRIERAKAMLRQTNTPIVEIALSVGFQSQSHFSTVFKRLTSQTPLEWRRIGYDIYASPLSTAPQTGCEAVARVGGT